MSKEVLVKVEGVSKRFSKDLKRSLLYGLADVTSSIFNRNKTIELRNDEFWAVQDVNFEVRRGECLGLIGHNGAGKSTLLKMLNGLITPDKGRIEMHGRVGALIELGAGFNPLLTGRENIYNNGAVLGFSKKEIEEKFGAIVEFSELKDYLDMPVQNYSSGMRVRLGFAVAAQMEPDILLVDEVLAVGDMGFVLKCFNQMDKLLQNTALILVSHSMPQVSRMATQILMLERGKVQFHSTNVSDGLTEYYKRYKLEISDYKGSEKAEFLNWKISNEQHVFTKGDDVVVDYGKDMVVEIEIMCKEEVIEPEIHLVINDAEQRGFAGILNFKEQIKLNSCKGKLIAKTFISNINFAPGKYSITIVFIENKNGGREILFRYQSAIYFTVHGKTLGWTPLQINAKWEHITK